MIRKDDGYNPLLPENADGLNAVIAGAGNVTNAVRLCTSNGSRIRVIVSCNLTNANAVNVLIGQGPDVATNYFCVINANKPDVVIDIERYGALVQGEIWAVSNGGGVGTSVCQIVKVR